MNNRQKIALISIGQTPRPDITADYYLSGCNKLHFIEFGALDSCDEKTIKNLAPLPGEADLVTRLADGRPVLISHERLTPYVQQAVNRAVAADVAVVVVQCTGHFVLHSKRSLIYPAQVLEQNASLLAGNSRSVFLLIPTPGQTTEAEMRWRCRGYTIAATQVIAPFNKLESLQHYDALSKADILIADCYGFTTTLYQQLRAFYHGPILIPRRLIAQLLISIWQ